MGPRQPEMRRHRPRLDPETDQREQQHQGTGPAEVRRGGGEAREREVRGRPSPEQEHDEQRGGAGVGEDEVEQPGPPDLLGLVLEDDEQESAQRHRFPEQEKQHGGPRGEDPEHRREKDRHRRMGRFDPPVAPLRRQVGNAVHRGRRRSQAQDEHEPAGQRIQFEHPGPARERRHHHDRRRRPAQQRLEGGSRGESAAAHQSEPKPPIGDSRPRPEQ